MKFRSSLPWLATLILFSIPYSYGGGSSRYESLSEAQMKEVVEDLKKTYEMEIQETEQAYGQYSNKGWSEEAKESKEYLFQLKSEFRETLEVDLCAGGMCRL